MKSAPLLLAFLLSALPAAAVEQWGLYEAALSGPADGNPFTEVTLTADFAQAGRAPVEVSGFYDGGGVYRVRFMPEAAGEWTYRTHSNRPELDGRTGTFTATAPGPGNHGPVRVAHTYHFAYADGTPFCQVGTTCYSWAHAEDSREEETLRTLAASPFNKLRMCVFPQNFAFNGQAHPRYPYAGTPPRNWDRTRFNPEFFRHLELRLGQLRDLGIEADLILFHPYDRRWGFSTMGPEDEGRYLRYVVARFAAYRNVWWSMANEYDFIRSKREADWDRIFQTVAQSDPYHHLRSIHNGALLYNNTHPWVTHASIQNGAAVEEPERAEFYRDVWRKPVVYDEVKYEGDSAARWGQLSGPEMVHRFWCGVVAGTYVGHSEIFSVNGHSWLADGGKLVGQSPPRLAFLRRVMEAAPGGEIDPIDKWQDERTGGKAGQYYLIYFGHEAPASWAFSLYKQDLRDGMKFQVEILDAWNMTVTPVPGLFVTRKRDNYTFADAGGRAVALPGRPYIALRIRRVSP
ncbi:MAG TPA: DUF5060 domain-containing protein [Opitutaceae bacterium]|nr:DUF5060 domain-containing protein [Opitutaceae bacterium]